MFINLSFKKYKKENFNFASNNYGFTLVELLVVIVIIAVLAGIITSTINSSGLRQKARDAEKIAYVKKLQAALELFFADNRGYPYSTPGSSTQSWARIGANGYPFNSSYGYTTSLEPYFNGLTDFDPGPGSGNDSPCAAGNVPRVGYLALDTNASDTIPDSYIIYTMLEVPNQDRPEECSKLNNWGYVSSCSGYTSGGEDQPRYHCYGVENP